MDMYRFFGGFLVYVAPPLISLISRKIKNNPSLKNPIWQYVTTFVIMTVLIFFGMQSYAAQMLLPAFFVYALCFLADFQGYRRNRTN